LNPTPKQENDPSPQLSKNQSFLNTVSLKKSEPIAPKTKEPVTLVEKPKLNPTPKDTTPKAKEPAVLLEKPKLNPTAKPVEVKPKSAPEQVDFRVNLVKKDTGGSEPKPKSSPEQVDFRKNLTKAEPKPEGKPKPEPKPQETKAKPDPKPQESTPQPEPTTQETPVITTPEESPSQSRPKKEGEKPKKIYNNSKSRRIASCSR